MSLPAHGLLPLEAVLGRPWLCEGRGQVGSETVLFPMSLPNAGRS